MKIEVIKGSVEHDKKSYGIGKTLTVQKEEGLRLIKKGVAIEVLKETKSENSGNSKKDDGQGSSSDGETTETPSQNDEGQNANDETVEE